MSENGTSNVTQVLKALRNFLVTYENPLWPKNATIDDIKAAFKLGNFIEKTIANFKAKDFLAQFFVLLELWGKENKLRTYPEEFYLLASDCLLVKLFKFPNIKENTLDVAVRVYTAFYPRDRFKECIRNLIGNSASLKAIADLVNYSITDKTGIENGIILAKYSEYLKSGLKEELKSEFEANLSLYNVEEKLPRVISILALNQTLPNKENDVKELLLSCLLNKMVDRSLLSKSFWLTLFKKVNPHHIRQACQNHPTFLESLFSFIEYTGGMMIQDKRTAKWLSDPNISFCHEISYFELVVFLKIICFESTMRKGALERLEQAKKYSNSELWSHVISDILE